MPSGRSCCTEIEESPTLETPETVLSKTRTERDTLGNCQGSSVISRSSVDPVAQKVDTASIPQPNTCAGKLRQITVNLPGIRGGVSA